MEITKEQYNEWRQHQVTKEVFKVLEWRKDKLGQSLGLGGATDFAEYKEAVGHYREVISLLEMAYEDMREE